MFLKCKITVSSYFEKFFARPSFYRKIFNSIIPDNFYKMADSFSCQAKAASRDYLVYKEITWENVTIAIESNEASKQIDLYCCPIQIKSGESVVTVGHIPREISRHCYFFLKEEGGEINANVFSTTYQPTPILSGGLGIPLVLYDCTYTGAKADSSDEEP